MKGTLIVWGGVPMNLGGGPHEFGGPYEFGGVLNNLGGGPQIWGSLLMGEGL